jgi:hypothetical protein
MGTIKTTISIDDEIWKRFTIHVIEKFGLRKKNEVLEKLIRNYIEENEWPIILDTIWAFDKDILELRKSWKEAFVAHTSQPIGKPLHRYSGTIHVEEEAILLSGKDVKTGAPTEIFIRKEDFIELFLGWDDTLRRWKDTRAWMRPLRLTFEVDGAKKSIYIHAKGIKNKIYGKKNKKLYEILKSVRDIKPEK